MAEGDSPIRNQQVAGSNPIAGSTSSKALPTLRGRLLFFISVLFPCKNLAAPPDQMISPRMEELHHSPIFWLVDRSFHHHAQKKLNVVQS